MDNIEWPSHHVPQPVKDIIARFYSLVDNSTDPNCSRELAEMVFTKGGQFIINKREMKGPEEIVNWRTGGDSITFRHHEVHKVYTCNDQGDDLLMTGTLTLGVENGLTADGPYCARCVVDDATSESPRIKYWQGWVDNSPFAAIGLRRERTPSSGVLDTIGGR